MARNPKQDANLKPIKSGDLSKEELKKRQSNGGKKSGEVRREKRDARMAARYVLERAAKGTILEGTEILNLDKKDGITNMDALMARLFSLAMTGNLDAYKELMKYAGYAPEENRSERESLNKDRRLDVEMNLKKDALASRNLEDGTIAVGLGQEEGGNDVFIYLPKIEESEEDKEIHEAIASEVGSSEEVAEDSEE